MTDDSLFSAANPFRSLDKKQFRAHKDKQEKSSVPTPKKRQSADDLAAADSFYAQFGDPTDSEAKAFLTALSGVTPLGAPKTPQKTQPARPPLHEEALKPFLTETSKDKKTPADETNRRNVVRQNSHDAVERQDALNEEPLLDEEDSFFSAMQDVAPLAGKGREIPPVVKPKALPKSHPQNPMQEFMDGKLEFSLAFTNEYVEGHVVGLDLLTVGKLQAGHFSPEAHLDLHGMTAIQAFEALVGFIRGAYFKGYRTLLLVPGRGLNSPQGISVLRDKVQDWLTQEPLRRVVLAFCTARQADGGAGALYVLLRKYRKGEGKVYWDRRPADPDLLVTH